MYGCVYGCMSIDRFCLQEGERAETATEAAGRG